ncbi:MAG: LOG family protein [Chloroflexi bacterium]|nr:LOG family protein [Chloroflexota bacterium]
MNVVVFGGSQAQEGSSAYEQARELGAQLANLGYVVITGGYMGIMEAASRGAHEAGGHVVGVTCDEIEAWRKIRHNPWVKEERRRSTLFDRLQSLVLEGDAGIALPGGPGTLAEIALMWNLMIINAQPPKPLILLGGGWKSVFGQMFKEFNSYIPGLQRELLYFADSVDTAVKLISETGKG